MLTSYVRVLVFYQFIQLVDFDSFLPIILWLFLFLEIESCMYLSYVYFIIKTISYHAEKLQRSLRGHEKCQFTEVNRNTNVKLDCDM